MNAILNGPTVSRHSAVGDCASELLARIERCIDGKMVDVGRGGQRCVAGNRELLARARKISSVLTSLGVASKSRATTLLCIEDALSFIPAFWACILADVNVLTLQHFGSSAQNLADRLSYFATAFEAPVLLITRSMMHQVDEAVRGLFHDVLCLDDLAESDANLEHQTRESMSSASLLVATSGSTGLPKIVDIPFRTYLARMATSGSADISEASLTVFPIDTLSGPGAAWPHAKNACFIRPDRFAADPLEALKLIEEYRIPRLIMTSGLASRMSRALEGTSASFDLSSLKVLGFGSEMVVPHAVRKLADTLQRFSAPPLKIAVGYGMTETGLLCGAERTGYHQLVPDAGRETVSVGACLKGCAIRIVDDSAAILPEGETGDIEVLAPAKIFSGYYRDENATANAFTADGWFKTGDLGFISGGEVTVTGRAKAIIVVNGRKISLEQVECRLRTVPGLLDGCVAGVAVRLAQAATDQLAVFFVPLSWDAKDLVNLCRTLNREIAAGFGVSVGHFIPLGADSFPRRALGKVLRRQLSDGFNSGNFQPFCLDAGSPRKTRSESVPLTATQAALLALWTKALRIAGAPGLDDDFYDLGGDSMSSAELIMTTEDTFDCDIPIEGFFASPTIRAMAAMVDDIVGQKQGRSRTGEAELLHAVRSYIVAWSGQPLVPNGLLRALNIHGAKPPLFWVFQDKLEFEKLAHALGPEQPLYGMRSLVNIVKIKHYTAEVLEMLTRAYEREISLLPREASYVIGGNCQGGIIALALARRLANSGRSAQRLLLMEWNFHFGRYDDPTTFLFGAKSHTARLYGTQDMRPGDPNWRMDFPNHQLCEIPGGHGEFFQDKNIRGLMLAIVSALRISEQTTLRQAG